MKMHKLGRVGGRMQKKSELGTLDRGRRVNQLQQPKYTIKMELQGRNYGNKAEKKEKTFGPFGKTAGGHRDSGKSR